MEPTDSSKSNTKKLKLCSEEMKNKEGEDRISNLPKSVLHHILSFLDMKYVVQTSILSRTWRYLWTSHPVLNFDCELFYSKKPTRVEEAFRDFVDEVLILRDGSNIQRFRLYTYRMCDYFGIQNRLYTWIDTAVRRNVQELYLDVCFAYEFQFPNSFHTCKSLEIFELKSSGISLQFKIPVSMSLPRLKTLVLQFVTIDGDDIPKIFSSCPVLESLTIIDSEFNKKNLDISAPTLKHLVMENCEGDTDHVIDEDDYRVKLCAPNLISFRCIDFMWKDYSIKNLSSLLEADIYMYFDGPISSDEIREIYAGQMTKFLRALHNVEILTLSACILQVLTGAPALLESTRIQLRNLRCLKLATRLSRNYIESITYLLTISPNIESLSLKIIEDSNSLHPYWDEVWFNSAKIEAYWEAGVSLQCVLHHLKSLEIRGVQGYVNELILLESLLKNAMVLEKMVLVTSKEESPHTEERFIKFTQKLLSFPRASPSVAILFF